jgi:serine/threonine-protein kinase
VNIGDVIAGRYRLEGLLGRGGMSSVYWAHDRVLERDVAVKVLHERLSADPDQVERFRREARAIASLSHPNVVRVIERGQVNGSEFIVFELVRGKNLKALLLGRRGLPVAQALGLTLQAARGLAAAHEHGIVHRDVKPQNVLVDDDGAAKVTDFGVARAAAADALTQSGTVLGTSDYLSPEQASGRPVDARSDQYSLGVLLFELLTGEVPYPAETPVAAALRHVNDPVPSVRDYRPEVSPRVDAIARRALAKRPDDRYASMDAMAAALKSCLAEEKGPERWPIRDDDTESLELVPPRRERRPPPERRRLGWRVPLVIAAVVAAAVAAAFVATGRVDPIPDRTPGGGAATGGSVQLEAVGDYDPEGGDGEHPELVELATDGDPATFWSTETYLSFQKAGVGIVVDAGRRVALDSIVVVSDDPGFTATILAANRADGRFRDVSSEQTVEEQTTFAVDTDGKEFRYYVVWITGLDERAHLNEVRAAD